MKEKPQINLDWRKIKTIFLDMDGTLLDLHFDNYFWLDYLPVQYAKKHDLTVEVAQKKLLQKYRAIEGTLNWYSLDHWQQALDMDIVALKHEVADKIILRDYVISFLKFLRTKNKRIILLTNAHRKTIALKFSYVPLSHFFDGIISAHDLQIVKEQQGFWEALAEIETFDGNTTLFIDDNLAVLEVAKKSHIKYLYGIAKPDSKLSIKSRVFFPTIHCFSQFLDT